MTSLDVNYDPEFETAEDVANFMLEQTRLAYVERSFEHFRLRMHLPQLIGTFTGERTIETIEEVRAIYSEMCRYMDRHGVVDLYRRTIAATFESPDLVKSTFVSKHVMSGYAISEEIVAHGELVRVDGRWKIRSCSYATDIEEVTRILSGETWARRA